MPSSYTPLLRLVLPVTGELTGTWGDTVNNGITSLLEAAVAGTAAVTMTDADYTLTTANEATDEARNAVIVLSGTLTASRNVICPTSSKLYVVRNATTGGFPIVFKTSAGTGITVANGETRFVRCDGTNVVEAFNAFTGNVTGNVAGNVSGNAGGTAANITGIAAVVNGGTGADDIAEALANLGALAADTQTKAANYTVVAGDRGDVIWGSGTWTLALTAAATLADGFSFGIVNTGVGAITINPDGAETVDGAATKDISPGQSAFLITDGSNWRTLGTAAVSDASETVKGIVELATTAEAQAGTDTTRAITPANLAAAMLGGVGQVYVNVTGSRALNTNYTNTSGRPRFVTVSQTTGGIVLVPRVGGVDLAGIPGVFNANVAPTTFFVVPPGLVYSVQTSGASPVLNQWVELQ